MESALYQLLNTTRREIRSLELEQGRYAEDIKCHLIVTPTDTSCGPSFEALSYVWGTRTDPAPTIRVDGQKIEVTNNLESALRGLRYENQSRVLWVDALCINQGDNVERSYQVRMMRSIYVRAHRVVVWLGSGGDELVMDFILRVASDPKLHWFPRSADLSEIGETPHTLLGVFLFLKNPWWRRMWTAQETVVANDLIYVCGSTVFSDGTFKAVCDSFANHSRDCCSNRYHAFISWDSWIVIMADVQNLENMRKKKSAFDFLEIASIHRQRGATDDRDKVYALIGLTEGLDEGIINYDLPVFEAYEKLALEVIRKSNNLNVFNHVMQQSKFEFGKIPGTRKLASWAPNWAAKHEAWYFICVNRRYKLISLFNASGNSTPVIDHLSQGMLRIRGVDFDFIKDLGPILDTERDTSAFFKWRQIADIDKNPEKPYVGGGSWLEAYWRTLCLDCRMAENATRFKNEDDRRSHDQWWWNMLLQRYGEKSPQEQNGKGDESTGFGAHAKTCTHRQRFFVSNKGYIGLVPPATELGDQIFIFLGGKTPYVIRPQKEASGNDKSPTEYHFIGEAYVHGLMDGEVMTMIEKGNVRFQDVLLR